MYLLCSFASVKILVAHKLYFMKIMECYYRLFYNKILGQLEILNTIGSTSREFYLSYQSNISCYLLLFKAIDKLYSLTSQLCYCI